MYAAVTWGVCTSHLIKLNALQKATREAVQQLIEQLRGRGKTALTVLLLGADKLQHP